MFESPDLNTGSPGTSSQEATPSPLKADVFAEVTKEFQALKDLRGLATKLQCSDLDGDDKASEKGAPSVAAPPAPGADDQDLDGVEPPPPSPDCCGLCRKKARANKSKFCGVCRSDVCAAKRDCEKNEKGPWFAKLMKTGGPDFVDFMSSYVRANGATRRKYSQRCSLDFVRYEEAKRVQTSLKLGFKASSRVGSGLLVCCP